MAKRFTIREVADRSGVAPSALRFYEERGLISCERDAAGRRTYAPEVHVDHILTKLGFRTRTQLAAWAYEAGL